jgi:hypothetical protein
MGEGQQEVEGGESRLELSLGVFSGEDTPDQ